MPFRALKCPHCAGPLPAKAWRAVVTCGYCGRSVSFDGGIVRAADFRRALAELDEASLPAGVAIRVADSRFRVLGHVARGESSDVFLAVRSRPLTERVLLKVLRADDDKDLLEREWDVLNALQASEAQGAPHFSQRLPQPVARGALRHPEADGRPALVLRQISGFVHTLDDVARAYPQGIDPRHGVWLWRRMLELLGWIHRSGWQHSAILPQHVVVHARDHGVLLVGWSSAVRSGSGERPPAVCESHRAFYLPQTLDGSAPPRHVDLVMSARCVAYALGRSPTSVPASLPAPLARLLRGYVEADAGAMPTLDAWELASRVKDAAAIAFGPPTFHPFPMPGWSISQSA